MCLPLKVVVLAGGVNDFHTAPSVLDEWRSHAIELKDTVGFASS